MFHFPELLALPIKLSTEHLSLKKKKIKKKSHWQSLVLTVEDSWCGCQYPQGSIPFCLCNNSQVKQIAKEL